MLAGSGDALKRAPTNSTGCQELPSPMLFKTQSAAVYGIDAYLVEVEVDVGSARMQDFNVVGLPDNAVKESRERIKSALRNCGYEFPYGQGVTINLAPADVRKEGSGFDLPMALGLVGDRKSTRLNSSHPSISYAVFCLKKKK